MFVKTSGADTPEPKTPSKQANLSATASDKSTPNTPIKNKKGGKIDKLETPLKSRKRGQDKCEDPEIEEKDLGLFKKKRERAEVRLLLTLTWRNYLTYFFFQYRVPQV
jgi:hypothetical protein